MFWTLSDGRNPTPKPGRSSTAATATMNTALGQRGGVQQLGQLGLRQARGLESDIHDRPLLLVGLFGRGGAFLVADDRIERGHEDGILVERFANMFFVDLEAGDRLVSQQHDYVRQDP